MVENFLEAYINPELRKRIIYSFTITYCILFIDVWKKRHILVFRKHHVFSMSTGNKSASILKSSLKRNYIRIKLEQFDYEIKIKQVNMM